jgi:lysophospholipase L1-like esterase
MKKNLLLMGGALLLALLMAEGGIRLLIGNRLPVKDHREDMFWIPEPQLGWANRPGASGDFSNGLFSGHVVIDDRGNRQNADASTHVFGYDNILFLGDSTGVSMEVDNAQTVPALLEAAWRRQGRRVNVINAAVRGYGTDQSVRKALALSGQLAPTQVIYMYCDNDITDNNTLKRAYRKYGKGVYLRPVGEDGFKAFNYPVPPYPVHMASLVVFDGQDRPQVHQALLPAKDMDLKEAQDRFKVTLKRHIFLFRAFSVVQDQIKHGHRTTVFNGHPRRDVDPFQMIAHGTEWDSSFDLAYMDGADLRRRCKDYFHDQMRFLLSLLRQIPTLTSVVLVWFPSENEMALFKAGTSVNHELFCALKAENVVDVYINLNQNLLDQGQDINRLRAPADHHFSASGNRWICEQILQQLQ